MPNSVEVNQIEEAFANMILGYQINFLKKNGSLPDIDISSFCSHDTYEREFIDRISEMLHINKNNDANAIDIALTSGSLKSITKNEKAWSLLTGIKISKDDLRQHKQESTPALSDKVIVTVRRKRFFGIFGKYINKKRKLKVDKKGGFTVPEKFEDMTEIVIPEGVKYIGYMNRLILL